MLGEQKKISGAEAVLKRIYNATWKKLFPSATEIIDAVLVREMKECSTVLDLGCGPSSPLKRIKSRLKPGVHLVGVDDFEPYLAKAREGRIHDEYVKSNIFAISFPDKSFDCAVMLDVIEHFEKEEFLRFLPKLAKIAKKIIVLTPNGFVEQKGYDGNEYQVHKSGWTTEDMTKLGFKVFGVSGLKWLRGEEALPTVRPVVLGNFLANLSEPLVASHPSIAYHLLCVKNNEK